MTRARAEILICGVLLACIFALSLSMRIAFPWDHVFSGQWIKFTDNDPYFYARLLDNLSHHFPLLGNFDPYFLFPVGIDLSGHAMFLVHFMGFFTWLFGGAAPSEQSVSTVAVMFPAVMGALLVFPVFFTARAIFNKWAGLAAALFIALIPGEFLARTLLGDTDTHFMEMFLSTLFIMFTVMAVRAGQGLASSPVQGNRRRLWNTVAYGACAGLSLGVYLLSWQGAPLFIFISFVWLVVQFIINHFRRAPSGYLGLIGAVSYLIALGVSFSSAPGPTVPLALAAAIAASVALPLISHGLNRGKVKGPYYLLIVAALAAAGIAGASIIAPNLFQGILNSISGVFNWNPASTIAETQPLLINQGSFTLVPLWGNYTMASVMGILGLAIVIYRCIRKGEPAVTLLAVWSILALLAALALRRFAYYFAIDAAILSGYTGWLILKAAGIREGTPAPEQTATIDTGKRSAKARRARQESKRRSAANPAVMALGIAAVAVLAVYPNTGPLPGGDRPFYDVSTRALNAPSNAWMETMHWMRDNTPDPFGDPQYYNAYYDKKSRLLLPSYGVMCWWDYGYLVSREAHRVPFSNPGTAQRGEQYYFVLQAPQEPGGRQPLPKGVNYVIVNDYLVDWTNGFRSLASDAGSAPSNYLEVYYRQAGGKLSPTLLYYPEFYRTMSTRLYCYDGKPYTPTESAVITWEPRTDADGKPYKEITGLNTFRSYDEAAKFLATQKAGSARIVGKDPNVSPVPLDALAGYRLVHSSGDKVKVGNSDVPEVKVFEYTP